jgi:asparagine synthase (glutamine-hydrolysing)
VHAWHCNYSDPQCNATAYAREVASGNGDIANPTTLPLLVYNADEHPDLVARLESIVEDFDELTIGSVILPLDELMGRVRARGDKVILTGSGGDELFGGYTRYQLALGHGLNESYSSLFDKVKNMPWAIAFEASHAKGADVYRFVDEQRRSDARVAFFRAFDDAGGAIGFDRRWFLAGLLNIDDKIAGRHGLESRPSLLHQRFVRRMMEIEPPVVPEIKRVGKQLAAGIVPQSVISRRDKMGYTVPIGRFVNENSSRLREYVSSSRHRDLFDLDAVRWTTEPGAGKFDRAVFGLALLTSWLARYT